MHHAGADPRWTLGGNPIEKPTRDFSVQVGSWQEVGDAIGVEAADDRLEPSSRWPVCAPA
jgi:hypothetical protein